MRLSFVVQIKSDSALASLLRLCWSEYPQRQRHHGGEDSYVVKSRITRLWSAVNLCAHDDGCPYPEMISLPV